MHSTNWFFHFSSRYCSVHSSNVDGWELEPEACDATLTLPCMPEETGTSMLSRIVELGPKVWLLCFVHCHGLLSAGLALNDVFTSFGIVGTVLGLCTMLFPLWMMLYMAAGVVENMVRRWVWWRLLENGVLVRPEASGYLELLHTPEFVVLAGGLLLTAAASAFILRSDGTTTAVIGSAASLAILHKVWISDWKLPDAATLLCGESGVSSDFIGSISCVSERDVAAACAALPHGSATSFSALKAHIVSLAPATDPLATVTERSPVVEWTRDRNWAMRFMGVFTPVTLVARLPVRDGRSFVAERDRTFSTRMNLWLGIFQAATLAVQFTLRAERSSTHLAVTVVLVCMAARPLLEALAR